jgi:hypothetical protein
MVWRRNNAASERRNGYLQTHTPAPYTQYPIGCPGKKIFECVRTISACHKILFF